MERSLDKVYSILKVLCDGPLCFTDLINLSTKMVGSSASAERAIGLSMKLGLTEKLSRGVYSITQRGRKIVEALEVPIT